MKNFEIAETEKSLKIVFPSQMENIEKVTDTVLAYVVKDQIAVDAFDLKVVLLEIISNAVRHGNACDPTKMVTFSMDISDTHFVIKLWDEGKGFSIRKSIDNKSAVLEPHGMGLTIITSLGYEMSVNENENYLYITKELEV